MADSWDVPPRPWRGDDSDDITYSGVGRVLSQWEELELQLGASYSAFMGQFEDLATMQRYGVPRIFDARLNGLVKIAEEYFARHPDQAREGAFCDLVARVRGFAARRNDVAHGVVQPFTQPGPTPFGNPFTFFLVPPIYGARRSPIGQLGAYAYTRPLLLELALAVGRLRTDIRRFNRRLARGLPP